MNTRITTFIIASMLLAASVVYVAYHGFRGKTQSEDLRIAIFTPTTHSALEEIERGFKETLGKLSSQSYLFTTFNANGNRTLLRAQAEEIAAGDYDLIFTIGVTCSQTISEIIKKKGITNAHVFGGVDGPEFAQSLILANAASAGVYVKSDYQQEMEILHQFKPAAKKILLVYDPTHGTGLEKDKQVIEQHIKKFGMQLQCVEIYQTNELQQKVAALLPQVDVVLVLTDNTVVAGIEALVVLCNRYRVTLLASDLASGKKGAALAYGITEYESGSGAAQKAHDILIHGKKPCEVALSAVVNFRIAVNAQTMKAQNLDVNAETLQRFEGILC